MKYESCLVCRHNSDSRISHVHSSGFHQTPWKGLKFHPGETRKIGLLDHSKENITFTSMRSSSFFDVTTFKLFSLLSGISHLKFVIRREHPGKQSSCSFVMLPTCRVATVTHYGSDLLNHPFRAGARATTHQVQVIWNPTWNILSLCVLIFQNLNSLEICLNSDF